MSSISPERISGKKSWKEKIRDTAESTWSIAAWVWTAIIIAFAVGVASGIAAGPQQENVLSMAFKWLSAQHSNLAEESLRRVILLAIVLFLLITLLSLLFRQVFKSSSESEWQEIVNLMKQDIQSTEAREAEQKTKEVDAFKHYLRSVQEMNQSISPRGLFKHSRILIFPDVPLEDAFVRLDVVSDRPVYDAPTEQERQRRRIEQRTDLSIEERDDYMQRLHFSWHFQVMQGMEKAPQLLSIGAVLQRLTSDNPVAIILGMPGSGKTTFLRWLAFEQARSLLSSDQPSLPGRPLSTRVPILLTTNDYAERLEREPITLRQFLISQVSKADSNASTQVFDALDHGRCLVLFDGLDVGLTPSLRRRVIGAIYEFITDHSAKDPQTQDTNRFIIASRIADYEPAPFSKYAHYTLFDLDDQKMQLFLQTWWYVIERYRALSTQGRQPPSQKDIVEVGTRLEKQMWSLLESNSSLKRLAASPLALSAMVFLQANGRNLLRDRFDLYQMVTRTLLDTWNRESGRKMFSEEEMPLVEELLANFAARLQESSGVLPAYEVEMITRQVLAASYEKQPQDVKDNEIAQLIETLRRSSGLFVEVGEELFCFANPTFQEYFAALYLLHRSREERRQLAVEHYRIAAWSEPLLLMLMYKNRQRRRDEQGEVNEILQAILNAPKEYDVGLPYNLLFVMSSIVNGSLQVTDTVLAQQIRSSAQRLAQQDSVHITPEHRLLATTLLHQLDRSASK